MSWPCPALALRTHPGRARQDEATTTQEGKASTAEAPGRGRQSPSPQAPVRPPAREPHLSTFERHIYFSTLSGLGFCLSSRAAQLHWYLHLLLGSPPFTSYSSCSPHSLHAHTLTLLLSRTRRIPTGICLSISVKHNHFSRFIDTYPDAELISLYSTPLSNSSRSPPVTDIYKHTERDTFSTYI